MKCKLIQSIIEKGLRNNRDGVRVNNLEYSKRRHRLQIRQRRLQLQMLQLHRRVFRSSSCLLLLAWQRLVAEPRNLSTELAVVIALTTTGMVVLLAFAIVVVPTSSTVRP